MLLSELDRNETKATFFVLGEVALVVPEVVKEIARKGHEIASHSPIHVPPRMVPRDELERLIGRDVALLEDLSGKRPIGFRAPYFSVRRDDGWLFSLLSKLGFRYDSSISPTWTPYWGIPSSPKAAYYPDFSDLARPVSQGQLLELPLTVWPLLKHAPGLPIAGGFYMRIWPTRLLGYMYERNVKAGRPLVLYVHPGNLESNKESVRNPSVRDRISQYVGSGRGLPSFRFILRKFSLNTIATTFSSQLKEKD
jgi:polysaccharide deacetylase family protein (PEP-CTERM system associated)